MVVFSSAYSSVTKIENGKKYSQVKGYTLSENKTGKKKGKVHYKDSTGKKVNKKISGSKSKFDTKMKKALKKIGWENKQVASVPRPQFIFSPDSIISKMIHPKISIGTVGCKKIQGAISSKSKLSRSKSPKSKSPKSKKDYKKPKKDDKKK